MQEAEGVKLILMGTNDKSQSILYVIEQHEQLLELWRSVNSKALRVAHLDFHCDMRGLLIDYAKQLAYPVSNLQRLDEGNFLTHAILEERVQSIHWIHNIPGGRKYDVGTVMYMTDLSVQPRRWLLAQKRQQGIPIQYKVTEFTQWNGLVAGEFLDIDWDFFASKEYSLNTIDSRVEIFFSKEFECIPKQISVCYSSRYSHPSQEQFEKFVHRLAEIFQAKIVFIPAPLKSVSPEIGCICTLKHKLLYQFKHMHYETILCLRKRNIF
ncbi:hypothetical protein ACFLV7_13635 [Chloroflexota bacterium]